MVYLVKPNYPQLYKTSKMKETHAVDFAASRGKKYYTGTKTSNIWSQELMKKQALPSFVLLSKLRDANSASWEGTPPLSSSTLCSLCSPLLKKLPRPSPPRFDPVDEHGRKRLFATN